MPDRAACEGCLSPKECAPRGLSMRASLGLLGVLLLAGLVGCPRDLAEPGETPRPLSLSEVRTWAYQIQGLDAPGAVEALAASSYDLLVIEPTRTDFSSPQSRHFDTAAAVNRLKTSLAGDGLHRKLVVAYIDIGEAENWRWYWDWSEDWPAGEPRPADWPTWIVTPDPDGWEGNFPVEYWDAAWQDIVIYGQDQPATADRDFASILDEVLHDGFDGVYLDWVEAYSDDAVAAAADRAGVHPVAEMVSFIAAIRANGRSRQPGFLVIQQNAAALTEDDPDILDVVDAIGQEDTWFGGQADCPWEQPCGHDVPQDPEESREIQRLLDLYRAAGKPVFTVDYTVEHAAEVYTLAASRGYVPYCSRTALSRLTTTPPPAP